MFSNIVVGTDGSDTAALAVALAADLAKQHGAVIHLVNAYKVSTGGVAVVHAGAAAVADPAVSGEVLRGVSEKLLTNVAQTISGIAVKTALHPRQPGRRGDRHRRGGGCRPDRGGE